MKLVKCRECKKEVSKKEKKCPHCGVKNPGITNLESLLGFAVLVIICVSIYYFVSGDDKKKPSTTNEAPEKISDKIESQASPQAFKYADEHLKDYRNKPQKDRKEIVANFISYKKVDKSYTDVFYNCLSQMSYTKSTDLKLSEVLGWCYVDFKKDPNALNDRINLDTFVSNFSGWDSSYRPLEKIIKNTMNDDSSYKHVETTYRLALNKQPPYAIVQTTFKGTNAYGAIVKDSLTAKVDIKTGEIIELINE
ncbi:hypothetical protein [Xenorhabdus bovienii]|uniref:hypothetical protein n=1 Tax=Xenorhabdus bovienii TaxID=40576 RepID=UPI0004D3C5DF|nr:hypothetical protein [Xenorhabdus bovienii]CDG86773.1 hypothetical protein XBFFR1_1280046 [Xenorhabdus bovienii str. feltiae France]CDG94389.1 hypothetical protein XBFFL1_480046 [Xenorhabdus bovienii str. feltiae Florida]